jgi:hypothetical protein
VDVDVYDIKLEMDIFVVIVIEGYLFVDWFVGGICLESGTLFQFKVMMNVVGTKISWAGNGK